MRVSRKMLFCNKYIIVAVIMVIAIPFLSWFITSNYYSALLFWDISDFDMTRSEYLKAMFSFEYYPHGGFALLQLIMPVFAMIIVIPYFNAKRLMMFSYSRVKSYKRFIILSILKYLIIGCTTLFLSYIVFLSIGIFLLSPFQPIQDNYNIVTEIFGRDLYSRSIFLFYVVDGFIKFFIFSFVYGLFAIAISFLTNKNFICIIVPVAYYVVFSIIFAVLQDPMSKIDLFYFSPHYTLMSTFRPYVSELAIISPLIPPFAFSLFVILRELVSVRKRKDAYAID